MLENNPPTGPEALAWVQRYLPQVLAADGRQPSDWYQARRLSSIACQQLRQHYGSGPASPEAAMVLLTLERLDTRLQDPAGKRNWPFAQVQLGRIMPLVERLLAA
jgi:hypothetical protein